MVPVVEPPPLDICIQSLKTLPLHASQTNSVKQNSRLYLAVIGFLCHLKADQSTLHPTRNEDNDKIPCPSLDRLPAISAVIQDPDLFQALLACLRVPPEQDGSALTLVEHTSHDRTYQAVHDPNSSAQQMSRKRTLSFSGSDADSHPHKSLKLHHSPVPNMKKKVNNTFAHPDGSEKRVRDVDLNVRVIAATILYIAFEHLDHWPASLVQVYAEDCFGPRLWVDDANCALLVDNLSLAHSSIGKSQPNDDCSSDLLEDANKVSSFYEGFKFLSATKSRPMRSGSFEDDQISTNGSLLETSPETRTVTIESHDVASAEAVSSDSDSGDEDEGFLEISAGSVTVGDPSKPNAGQDDSSSSGGSEMEVVAMAGSFIDGETPGSNPNVANVSSASHAPPKHSYPIKQPFLKRERVRPRYFGENLRQAQSRISDALSNRLDKKSKQNSRLLSCLPQFVAIPEVRRLSARHLERWLQSPALSGPARTLFGATVSHMRNIEPPLSADVEAIDSILRMRLKANQLNAHVENVMAIARNIPTVTISRKLFLRLFRSELEDMDNSIKDQVMPSAMSDQLRMIKAIRSVTSPSVASDAIAAALLTILAHPIEHETAKDRESMPLQERRRVVDKIRRLLRRLVSALGASQFDCCQTIESLLSFDVDVESWSVNDEEDKGRIMFECVTLLATELTGDSRPHQSTGQRSAAARIADRNLSDDAILQLRKKLATARKLMLSWCCADYALFYQKEYGTQSNERERSRETKRSTSETTVPVGAGVPNYSSILDGECNMSFGSQPCIDTMRCVLFMEEPDSPLLYSFQHPADGSSDSALEASFSEERNRNKLCHEYGADLDNEMMSIVLRSVSSGLDPEIALTLLEHLFHCCRKGRAAALRLSDPQLVWDLYELTQYKPTLPPASKPATDINAYQKLISGVLGAAPTIENGDDGLRTSDSKETNIPRLAYPGMWWRATSLALIMCGVSPDRIGAAMSLAHPTLKALIKMVTSNRYRFPTVDCDDVSREGMKKSEADLRNMESNVAELLFLKKKTVETKKLDRKDTPVASSSRGSRTSARQRAKQERILRLKREKEEAEAIAEANRRKKEFRAALKSIMLWDPKCAARKPPPESVALIHAVEESFGLADVFQQSVDPDFVLLSIGKSGRQSIERAYDWLIPVTSSHPEIINRLPSSASCFLLLQAYGMEEGGRSDLRELSSPLLVHVRESLMGKFGEQDAVRAADLLLADVADQHPDRRRCARRVLEEALSAIHKPVTDEQSNSDGHSWLFSVISLQHASALVSVCIQYISRALAFERGRVLKAFVLAVNRYITYAEEHDISGHWDFASIVYTLVSSRHNVYSESMDRYTDLRVLTVATVQKELHEYLGGLSDEKLSHQGGAKSAVQVILCATEGTLAEDEKKSVALPFTLIHAACVLLSNWRDKDDSDPSQRDTRSAIRDMASLFLCCNCPETSPDTLAGLQGATYLSSGRKAVTVDMWVMLAKSRSDYIARRAALSAPNAILPRLLLCSGLPRASLSTMFDRVEKLGLQAADPNKHFDQLLMPSVTAEWGVSFVGGKREIARKLRGRLAAYLRAKHIESETCSTSIFLRWLNEECRGPDMGRKPQTKRNRREGPQNVGYFSNLIKLRQILPDISGELRAVRGEGMKPETDDKDASLVGSTAVCEITCPKAGSDEESVKVFVSTCFRHSHFESLEEWLEEIYNDGMTSKMNAAATSGGLMATSRDDLTGLSVLILETLSKTVEKHEPMTAFVTKWVPLLSRLRGSQSLWTSLFMPSSESFNEVWSLLLVRCASTWCEDHTLSCRKWILSHEEMRQSLSPHRMTKFLVLTLPQLSVHRRALASVPRPTGVPFTDRETTEGTVLALECVKQSNDEGNDVVCVNSRDSIPDWLLLLLLLSNQGKKQMKCVTDVIVQLSSQEDKRVRRFLCSAVLRLYAYFPGSMELRNSALRSLLVEAADSLAQVWLRWRSPFDEQVEDMIASLRANPTNRIIQALSEMAKDYPLLLLRKLARLVEILNQDGGEFSNGQPGSPALDRRGHVQTGHLDTQAVAIFNKKAVKVTVFHWGCSFSEPLWVAVLDIVLMVPPQVLFTCGLAMGLPDLLNVCLRLSYLRYLSGEESKSTRSGAKVVELLSKFHSSNASAWTRWSSSPVADIKSNSTVAEILKLCELGYEKFKPKP